MSRAGAIVLTLAALAICPTMATQQGEQLKIVSVINSSLCASIPGMKPAEGINVVTRSCSATDTSQTWIFDSVTGHISPAADATLCLTSRANVEYYTIVMMPCDDPDDTVRWEWSSGGNIGMGTRCMSTGGWDNTWHELDSIFFETNDCSTPQTKWTLTTAVKIMKASEQKGLSDPSIQV